MPLTRTQPYSPLLTIPGVYIAVRGPAFLRRLDQTGRDLGTTLPRTGTTQDWRDLRTRLINLNFDDLDGVAAWLRDAGYEWVENITTQMTTWLRRRRDVVAWLMTLERDVFQSAITRARTYRGKIVFEPAQKTFKHALGAPDALDARTTHAFLVGAGLAPNLHASFFWGPKGRPCVVVDTDSPMEAIGLSIHIDQNYSVRRWTTCARCGSGFERAKTTDRFCSNRCADYVTTNQRRNKIKALAQATEAWAALPRTKRRGKDRWQWIAKHAGAKAKAEISPAWAKQVSKRKDRP
jgi:hypothetical protein